jgi:hypothetical protein
MGPIGSADPPKVTCWASDAPADGQEPSYMSLFCLLFMRILPIWAITVVACLRRDNHSNGLIRQGCA